MAKNHTRPPPKKKGFASKSAPFHNGPMLALLLANAVYIPDENGEIAAFTPPAALEPLESLAQATPPGDYGAAFAKMIVTLVALVALLAVTFWFLRRLVQRRLERGVGDRIIQIREKRMISPKTMLYVVEVEGKKVLLAESHLEVKKIADF